MKLGWHVAFVICLGKSRWWRTVTLEHLIRPALMENLSAFTWVDTDELNERTPNVSRKWNSFNDHFKTIQEFV